MATQTADPKTPEGKPHGTTKDQINEMESEGQAQTPGQPAPVGSPSAGSTPGASGSTTTTDPDESAPARRDQDIDTAGTEADPERSATNNPTGQPNDRNMEVPGDTESADIVGPTGEQMPRQSHDGLEGGRSDTNTHRSAHY